jgi:hypothetical protein
MPDACVLTPATGAIVAVFACGGDTNVIVPVLAAGQVTGEGTAFRPAGFGTLTLVPVTLVMPVTDFVNANAGPAGVGVWAGAGVAVATPAINPIAVILAIHLARLVIRRFSTCPRAITGPLTQCFRAEGEH